MNGTRLEGMLRLCACILIAFVAARYGWQPALASVLIFALGIASATVHLPARARSTSGHDEGMQWKGRSREALHREDERLEARFR